MASAFQNQSQVQEVLGVLRRRSWQIILPAAVVLSLGIAVAVIVPKKYEVATEIELRNTEDSELGKVGKIAQQQIRAFERVLRVVSEQQWPDYLALRDDAWRQEYVKEVLSDIQVSYTPGNESASFVRIEYKDVNPKRAMDFLKALRKSWVSDVLQRERNLAVGEEQRLLDERGLLERQYAREEADLADLRKRNGISATQPTPGSGQARAEDPVYERIQKQQEELARLDKEIASAEAEIELKTRRLSEEPPTVPQVEKVAGLSVDRDLEQIDARLRLVEKELASVRPANSQYRVLLRDREELLQRRAIVAARATDEETRQRAVPNPMLAQLRQEIADLELEKEKLASERTTVAIANEIDTKRNAELQEVYREVRESEEEISRIKARLEDTDKAYQSARRRVERLSSEEGNPFAITQEPALSRKPTEPNPFLIVAFGLFAGLGLGLGVALVGEFGKSAFRSPADVSRVLAAPVLGAVNLIVTRSEMRRLAVRRVLVGVLTLCFIGAVVFVTWAWAMQQELLPQSVRDAIEDLRSQMQ